MRITTTAMLAVALLSAGCGKKKLAELPPADVTGTAGANGTAGADGAAGVGADGSVAGAALPGSQADLVARARGRTRSTSTPTGTSSTTRTARRWTRRRRGSRPIRTSA